MPDARTPPRPTDRILESPIAATWRSVAHERAVLVGVGPGIHEGDLDELFGQLRTHRQAELLFAGGLGAPPDKAAADGADE